MTIKDGFFEPRPTLQPGQPCSHPGCACHLSHPCEGCGRYAAGTANGPDVEYARRYIEKLAVESPIVHAIIVMGQQNEWTWEQTLSVMVIGFQDELRRGISGSMIA